MYRLNTKIYKLLGSILLLLVSLALIAGSYSLTLYAQSIINPENEAAKSAAEYEENKKEELPDIEVMAYSKNKDGCATKANLFGIVAKLYRKGIPVEQAANMKIIQPLYKRIYKAIHTKGLEKALLDNMREYQTCVNNAKPHEYAEIEYDISLVNDACAKLNAVILDTLVSIKNRKKLSSVLNKYERKKIDLSGTSYKDIPDTSVMFISTLYKAAKTKEYIDVVEMGSDIISGCRI